MIPFAINFIYNQKRYSAKVIKLDMPQHSFEVFDVWPDDFRAPDVYRFDVNGEDDVSFVVRPHEYDEDFPDVVWKAIVENCRLRNISITDDTDFNILGESFKEPEVTAETDNEVQHEPADSKEVNA